MQGAFWPINDWTWFEQSIVVVSLIGITILFLPGLRRQTQANGLLARGRHFYEQARYSQAEAYYREALAEREQISGPDHALTGVIVNSLGLALQAQARNEEAEAAFHRALSTFEEAPAKFQINHAKALSNLGNLLKTTGRLDESEQCHRLALKGIESALGPNHPDVASTLNNLAESLRAQGRYEESAVFPPSVARDQ